MQTAAMLYTKGAKTFTFHQYVNIEAMYNITQSTKAQTYSQKACRCIIKTM